MTCAQIGYFRAHNLLTSGDGTPALKWGFHGRLQRGREGQAVYNWTILDRIFDTYLERGVRPRKSVSCRRRATKPQPYQHRWNPHLGYNEIFTGWAILRTITRNGPNSSFNGPSIASKYSRAEVETMLGSLEQPNIGYWRGTPAEFLKLHDYAIDAVRAPCRREVGGADTRAVAVGSRGIFWSTVCRAELRPENGTPSTLFLSRQGLTGHGGRCADGNFNQLRTVNEDLNRPSYPELKISSSVNVIENAPRAKGRSLPTGTARCIRATPPPASPAACLAGKCGVNLQAPDGCLRVQKTYFAGFRTLASNGIDKPILNVFRMFSKMRGEHRR